MRSDEANRRSDAANREQLQIAERGQINDRFATANDQLTSDKLEGRLGGIYALEQIMRDASAYYEDPIIEILSAYIRSHASKVDNATTETPTIDIQAALTVLSRRPDPGAHRSPDLRHTNLRGANLYQTDLEGASLSGADLRGANLSRTKLDGADLGGANLSGTSLHETSLQGADLSGANLSGASLHETRLNLVNLSGADLSRAKLNGASLAGVDLSRANLSGANLTLANLTLADLSGANLSGANLNRANLTLANLRSADLSGADLSGADLNRAQLDGAVVPQPSASTTGRRR